MNPTVLVIGSTLAGLTAALRLGRQGYAVTIIEQPEQHAASTQHESNEDAFPLVLMGCHTATLSLLEKLGTADRVQWNDRIGFELLDSNGRLVRLRRPPLPPRFTRWRV